MAQDYDETNNGISLILLQAYKFWRCVRWGDSFV